MWQQIAEVRGVHQSGEEMENQTNKQKSTVIVLFLNFVLLYLYIFL